MTGKGEGWRPPDELYCMVLKLTVYIRNVMSFSYNPKPVEILIFRPFFLAKFSILVYFSLKIGYFELGHDYEVTVTSYFRCWYLFWYVWKETTPSYTMVPITCIWGFHFQVQGVVTTLLVNCVTKKRFGRTRVKCSNDIVQLLIYEV